MSNKTDGLKTLTEEDVQNIESKKIVKFGDADYLIGKLLTIIDATYSGSEMNVTSTADFYGTKSPKSAVKDLIKNTVWDWIDAIPSAEK